MIPLQAALPASVDFPQHLQDKTYSWDVPRVVGLVADTAKDLYNTNAGLNQDKVQEKIIIQNLGAFPLKVCINDVCENGKFHYILPASSAVRNGTGGTYIHYPRLEDIRRISVISVGGVGEVASTNITCIKDL